MNTAESLPSATGACALTNTCMRTLFAPKQTAESKKRKIETGREIVNPGQHHNTTQKLHRIAQQQLQEGILGFSSIYIR